jgi:phospholipase C
MTAFRVFLALTAFCVVVPWPAAAAEHDAGSRTETNIEHFVVVMQGGHSFDNYFGKYPPADGFPADVCMPMGAEDGESCVRPFRLAESAVQPVAPERTELVFREQFNRGRMDGFVRALEARNREGRVAMGYYDERDVGYYWNLADEYVLFDRYFGAPPGPAGTSHLYWVTGAAAEGQVPEGRLESVTTIFDRLQASGVSWKFYIQHYDPDLNYRSADADSIEHRTQMLRVPLLRIDRFLDDPALAERIVDVSEYFEDLDNGTLPEVAYIISTGASETPPGSITIGQRFVRNLV